MNFLTKNPESKICKKLFFEPGMGGGGGDQGKGSFFNKESKSVNKYFFCRGGGSGGLGGDSVRGSECKCTNHFII